MTNLVRDFQAEADAKDPIERRLNIRLLGYWQELRGERQFPTIGDFRREVISDFQLFGFVLEFDSGPIDPVFRYVGSALARECGKELVDAKVSDVPRHTLLTQVTDHYLQVLANKAPIAFEAEFTNAADEEILYRSILLPFGKDGETIDHLAGAINFKIKDKAAEPASALGGLQTDASPSADLSLTLMECQALARKVVAAETRSRAALYRALEAAYGFYLECQRYPEAYAQTLVEAGLKAQARAPFTPVVKLIFGHAYDKTRLSEYAAALSYAQRRNQVGITIQSFFEAQPGGIKGCVAAERAARRAERGQQTDHLARAQARLRSLPPLARVAGSPDGGSEFVLLLGRRMPDSNGDVDVVRVLDEPPAAVDAALKRAAKALENRADKADDKARRGPKDGSRPNPKDRPSD